MQTLVTIPILQPILSLRNIYQLSAQERLQFLRGVAICSLGFLPYVDVRRELKFLSRDDCSLLCHSIKENFNLAVAARMATYFVIKNKSDPVRAFVRAGLTEEDSWLLEWLQQQEDLYPKLIGRVRKIKVPIPHPMKLREECHILVKKNSGFIGRFAGKKLWFIANGNKDRSVEDIINELRCKMISTYYSRAPYESVLYADNLMKRAAVNYGNNLIGRYTTKKRGRVRASSDGSSHPYYNVIQTESFMSSNGQHVSIYDSTASDENNVAKLEFDISLNHLKETATPQQNVVIDLMLHRENTAFIQWYNRQYGTDLSSIEDIIRNTGRRRLSFGRTAAQYAGMEGKEYARWINSFSARLGLSGN